MRLKNGRNGVNIDSIIAFMSIAILCLSETIQADIVPINSNSKVIDGIEYYVQTDKSIYTLGENVEMLYKVTNLNNYSVTFHVPSIPEYDFWVQKDGVDIWWRGHGFWLWGGQFTLEQNESWICPGLNKPYLWDMRDNGNNLVGLGIYNVIGGIFYRSEHPVDTKVSVPIQIVPEPSTILFFSIGTLVIWIRKK